MVMGVPRVRNMAFVSGSRFRIVLPLYFGIIARFVSRMICKNV